MNKYVCSLNEKEFINKKSFGGKASSLSKIMQFGFRVPVGYAISVDCFTRYCTYNSIDVSGNIVDKDIIIQGSIPYDIKEELIKLWTNISQISDGVIVRSSAIEEDGIDFSYAGIYDSILNVKTYDDLEAAVKQCWASYFDKHAIEYKKGHQIKVLGMGLVVQQMINGDKSGVTFTSNPLNGSVDELIVEAYPGLNFVVVDGQAQADRYVINKKDLHQESTISRKKIMYSVGEKSLTIDVSNIPDELSYESTLNDKEILKLVNSAKRIEEVYNFPCDIEWTIVEKELYILQVRPITTNPTRNQTTVYFDNDIPECIECSMLDRYSEPACTCYLSMLNRWQDVVYLDFYSKKKGKHNVEKPLQFFFNRVYWNLKYQKEYFDDIPFNDNSSRSIIKKIKLIKLMLLGYKSWYSRLKHYDQAIENFALQDMNNMNSKQLIDYFNNITTNFCSYIGRDHFQFLGMAHVCYNQLLKKIAFIPGVKDLVAEILNTNVCKNMTTLSNYEMVKIAQKAYETECVRRLLLDNTSRDAYRILKNDKSFSDFKQSLDEFLNKHGHRGTSCDDLLNPHWCEEPAYVLELIKQLIISNEYELFEQSNNTKTIEYFKKQIYNCIVKHYGTSRLYSFYQYSVVSKLVDMTIQYMILREDQRYYFDKSWNILRKLLLFIGNRFVEQSIIKNSNDVFHLTIDEILKILDEGTKPSNMKRIVERRKIVFERNKRITPPYLIKDNSVYRLQKKGTHRSFKAIGISPGNAIGTGRIVSSVNDLNKVLKGDIIVVSTFHPSWTPILKIVSGMVMNYGNILSHGAVVAREYGIPVVVFNDMATQVFEDGQVLEIDGTIGRIRISDKLTESAVE